VADGFMFEDPIVEIRPLMRTILRLITKKDLVGTSTLYRKMSRSRRMSVSHVILNFKFRPS